MMKPLKKTMSMLEEVQSMEELTEKDSPEFNKVNTLPPLTVK